VTAASERVMCASFRCMVNVHTLIRRILMFMIDVRKIGWQGLRLRPYLVWGLCSSGVPTDYWMKISPDDDPLE
jgi:hypothetical protein